MSDFLTMVGSHKVRVSKEGVAAFNATWPCSTLRATRAYWFEFDSRGDLVDTDVPEQDDGPALLAMSEDAKDFCFSDGVNLPDWA